MSFVDMVEKKWHELIEWYKELVEILTEFIRQILLSLPKAILGIIGFFLFIFGLMKIGWWVVPIYIVLMFLGIWIYYKFFEDDTD